MKWTILLSLFAFSNAICVNNIGFFDPTDPNDIENYNGYSDLCNNCGYSDPENNAFVSNEACCVCGGGVEITERASFQDSEHLKDQLLKCSEVSGHGDCCISNYHDYGIDPLPANEHTTEFVSSLKDKCPQGYTHLRYLDVSSVTNMDDLFARTGINQPLDMWDVSSVTSMDGMFSSTQFNYLLNTWDVSSVRSMEHMFDVTPFNQNISMWDVSSVTSMGGMFSGYYYRDPAELFTERIDTPFNQDISMWDVSSVTNMHNMFYISLFDQKLCTPSWRTNPNTADVGKELPICESLCAAGQSSEAGGACTDCDLSLIHI